MRDRFILVPHQAGQRAKEVVLVDGDLVVIDAGTVAGRKRPTLRRIDKGEQKQDAA